MHGDLEDFISWLRAAGTPEPNLELYRRGYEVLERYRTLDDALRAEAEAGASPRRLANLREVDAQRTRFMAELLLPPTPTPTLPPAPAPARAPGLELAGPARRDRLTDPPLTGAGKPFVPPRTGCTCRERQEVYEDDDLGVMGKLAGGMGGLGAFVLWRILGLLGAATLFLGFLGTGGLLTTFTMGFRCVTCRRSVAPLDADERADVWRGRAKFLVISIALLVGAAICAWVWIQLNDRD